MLPSEFRVLPKTLAYQQNFLLSSATARRGVLFDEFRRFQTTFLNFFSFLRLGIDALRFTVRRLKTKQFLFIWKFFIRIKNV